MLSDEGCIDGLPDNPLDAVRTLCLVFSDTTVTSKSSRKTFPIQCTTITLMSLERHKRSVSATVVGWR